MRHGDNDVDVERVSVESACPTQDLPVWFTSWETKPRQGTGTHCLGAANPAMQCSSVHSAGTCSGGAHAVAELVFCLLAPQT